MSFPRLRDALNAAIAELPDADVPDAIGALTSASARLTARLVTPAATTATDTRMLTAEQIAEVFSVPVTQIYALGRQHRIPSIRLGKYRRFDLAAVATALADKGEGSKCAEYRPRKRRSNGKAFSRAATALLPPETAPEADNG